jgi:hypothetical protein
MTHSRWAAEQQPKEELETSTTEKGRDEVSQASPRLELGTLGLSAFAPGGRRWRPASLPKVDGRCV